MSKIYISKDKSQMAYSESFDLSYKPFTHLSSHEFFLEFVLAKIKSKLEF